MGLEMIRPQVRDRGSPYAGPGESRGMFVFGNRGPGHRRWELPFGATAHHGIGDSKWDLFLVLFCVGFGLAARRGRPGGVRESGTTTTYPWELPFGSRSTECTCCTVRGTHLGTPRFSHSGDRSESARAMENNGEGTEGDRVEETEVGETGDGEGLTNENQQKLVRLRSPWLSPSAPDLKNTMLKRCFGSPGHGEPKKKNIFSKNDFSKK